MPFRQLLVDPQRSWRSSRVLVAIPLLLIAALTLADLLAPKEIQLSPLLITAPAITASFGGPRLTGSVSVLAIAVQMALDIEADALGTRTMQTELAALIVVSGLLVLFSFARDRYLTELTQVRSIAEAAQQALLRPLPARLGSLRFVSTYMAAQEEAQIGGDLYAASRTDHGTRVLIGDVRGKGLPSVSDAVLLLGAFREAARRHTTLREVVLHLDESVRADLEEHDPDSEAACENFITAALLDFPDDRPVLDLIDCGHPPPLLVRRGEVRVLRAARPAPPLGLGNLAEPAYLVDTFDFEVGDTLLLYTDGVIEARDPSGAYYPLAERVGTWREDGPEALVEHVRADLLHHVGGRLGDDAAMVAIQRSPGEPGAGSPPPASP